MGGRTGMVTDREQALLFYHNCPLWKYAQTFPLGILLSMYRPSDPCLYGGRLYFLPDPVSTRRYDCTTGFHWGGKLNND
jgi:hypothetical protein